MGDDGAETTAAAGTSGASGGGPRRTLSAEKKKGHQAFQAADRKLSVTRQPDFKPPSDEFREEMVKVFKSWRDEDQCTMWTKQCILEWNKNSSKVWGIRKGPQNLFAGRKLPENAETLFPDLEKGALGSCALVAVADSMLAGFVRPRPSFTFTPRTTQHNTHTHTHTQMKPSPFTRRRFKPHTQTNVCTVYTPPQLHSVLVRKTNEPDEYTCKPPRAYPRAKTPALRVSPVEMMRASRVERRRV